MGFFPHFQLRGEKRAQVSEAMLRAKEALAHVLGQNLPRCPLCSLFRFSGGEACLCDAGARWPSVTGEKHTGVDMSVLRLH